MNEEMKYKELVSRYADKEVTAQERELVEQLLKDNIELNNYYNQLKAMDSLLNENPVEEVSPDWENKVQATLFEAVSKEGKKVKKISAFRMSVGGGIVTTIIIGVIALSSMQVYIKRGIQGRLKTAADDIGEQFSAGNTRLKMSSDDVGMQYTPYYLATDYSSVRSQTMTESYSAPKIEQEFWGDEVDVRQSIVHNTEEYARVYENQFLTVNENPLSTFSIDVDTGSYSNIRRFLNRNQLPPADAVRIEEMLNYFSYEYAKPTGEDPFSINTDAAVCPWNEGHQLVRIGLQGKTLDQEEIPPSNLVFLIDVSGSMDTPNKLPLLKQSLKMMVNQLSEDQRVAMVVYAGAAGQVLESTPGSDKRKILGAIDRLNAGGSTAGGAGIKLAYKIAKENYIDGGNNRVILATDGDFNIGVSSTSEMTRLIEEKRDEGVFVTVLGFGMGNYKDNRLEQIANKGNGTYHYIDTIKEARKVLVDELGSTLFTIAKDVKLQIEFNPAQVKAYRLIGYENRVMAKEDFNDDKKDAGELGAGHTVTALYEIVPAGSSEKFGSVDELKYQTKQSVSSNEMMTVKLRYKQPDGFVSKLIKKEINKYEVTNVPQGDFEFAAAVAEFGMILRDSKYKGNSTYNHVVQAAEKSKGKDSSGYRQEFIELVEKARSVDHRPVKTYPNEEENVQADGFDRTYGNQDVPQRGIQFK